MKAIETTYGAQRFRSRLEARWASMFDQLGWQWEYEPFDLDGYIPDFILLFHRPLLVEVKPQLTLDDLRRHTTRIAQSGWGHEALIVGATPLLPDANGWELPSIGLLAERFADGWGWDAGVWFGCKTCQRLSVLHATHGYDCRIRGCHEGDHHIDPTPDFAGIVRPLWNVASAAVRWR